MGRRGPRGGPRGHLKSGMPLGVLMPAPTMTTTLWQARARISSATSCRESCAFSLLLPLPRTLETPAEEEMGLLPPAVLTEKGEWQVTDDSQVHLRLQNETVLRPDPTTLPVRNDLGSHWMQSQLRKQDSPESKENCVNGTV